MEFTKYTEQTLSKTNFIMDIFTYINTNFTYEYMHTNINILNMHISEPKGSSTISS